MLALRQVSTLVVEKAFSSSPEDCGYMHAVGDLAPRYEIDSLGDG
jgi:hypothetical protein